MTVKWSPMLQTGILLIDQQHKELIEAMNLFFIRWQCGQEKLGAQECVRFLEQFVQYHFQAEEAFQVECAYPKYKEHCARHRALTSQVKFCSVHLDSSDYSQEYLEELKTLLLDWVQKHLFEDDLEFATAYRNAKHASSVAQRAETSSRHN